MSCLFEASMSFSCEIWNETSEQDADTGQFIRTWEKTKTTKCGINTIQAQGRRSAMQEEFRGMTFDLVELIYVIVPFSVAESSIIRNIKAKNGDLVFTEPNGNDTIFQVIGKVPEFDGIFGNILGYRLFCSRPEVQEVDNA